MLYVPGDFAHGFQTLQPDTEVFYMVSKYYSPESAGGIRWNDPAFNIQWPEDSRTILERDLSYPDFSD
jgi:dTDP-4-dehydrorhamnose 3,5-epimerase